MGVSDLNRHIWRTKSDTPEVVKGGGRERELAALAGGSTGWSAKRQLSALGIGRRTIDRWLAVGRLHDLNRGVYAVGHDRVSQRGRWLAAVSPAIRPLC